MGLSDGWETTYCAGFQEVQFSSERGGEGERNGQVKKIRREKDQLSRVKREELGWLVYELGTFFFGGSAGLPAAGVRTGSFSLLFFSGPFFSFSFFSAASAPQRSVRQLTSLLVRPWHSGIRSIGTRASQGASNRDGSSNNNTAYAGLYALGVWHDVA